MPYFGVPIRNGLPIGLGTLTALAKAVAVVVPPVSSDPYFEYVSLLANTTSTNGAQNNTFLDSSTNAFSVTRNGNTTQGNFSPFSQTGWSNFFDGNGDSLTYTGGSSLNFGTGDFTIELWVYLSNTSTYSPFLRPDASGLFPEFGYDFFTGELKFQATSLAIISVATAMPTNQWVHVAACRNGTNLRVFINGAQIGTTTTNSTNFGNTTGTIRIGGSSFSATHTVNGYLSNFRVVNGTAVYTSNFTPPTAPLTAITNTSLLTCQSNRFIDNSSNAFAITRNGDVSVQAFSPFNPTAAWSASTNGGSGYFDGTGDFLETPATGQFAPTGNFTIGLWFYPNSALTINQNLIGNLTANVATDWLIQMVSGTFSVYTDGSTVRISSATAIIPFQWNYISVTRSSNVISAHVNGALIGTYSQSGTFGTATKKIQIGNSLNNVNGYISGVVLIDGSANTAVPTAPPNPTGTFLCLNFTNAGIYDSASGNDLETVGNAQVSTVQAKWGTTSMAFDGTGDSLTAVDRPALRFGTAPFTIEGWVYLNVINATQGIASKRNATPTGWFLQVTPSNKLQLTFDASTIASTASLAASTWYHFAIVREGTGTNQTKLYINGVNDGTGTVANNFNQTDALAVGSDRGLGSYLNGYIDDLRITNGYARYTANFTPPTAAFPLN